MSSLSSQPELSVHPVPRLGVWDVVSLLLGIVVGVSIFKVPGMVFQFAGSPWAGLGVWVIGAGLTTMGAMCYAELAAAYPGFGAEFIYLEKAYGRTMAFVFGWMQTFVILPGSLGAMAFVFASYGGQLIPKESLTPETLAMLAIGGLLTLQLLGFQVGRVAQNILTGVKVLSLSGVLICGLLLPLHHADPVPTVGHVGGSPGGWSDVGLALVFVLYAYGGWSDVATVAGEVRDCRRNVPRGLLIGIALVSLLYLLLNVAFLRVLGYHGICQSSAPAADIVRLTVGSAHLTAVMSLVVMASALGAIHGMMFSGSRLLTAIGMDFPAFRKWSVWNRRQVPLWSLLTIGGMSLLMTALLGTESGHDRIESLSSLLRLPAPDWGKFGGSFDVLVAVSAPFFWTFFCLSGLALIVMRVRHPEHERPFRVPLYPLTPLAFSATSAYMLWSSLRFAGMLILMVVPVLAAGILLALLQRDKTSSDRGQGVEKKMS